MVRHEPKLLRGRLRRADVHAAIKRHGVHGDDFSVQAPGQLQCQPGFSRARRARENESILEGFGEHTALYRR